VDAVGDHADPHARVGERDPGQPGLAVAERDHGVEQVGDVADAGVEGGPGLGRGGRRVAGGHDDPRPGQRAHEVERAGQLGRQRHEGDTLGPTLLGGQRRVRRHQPVHRVGAPALGGEERALEVQA
jgi:hypothetical protein